jgi:cation diffusion facilitator family transporter
MPPVKSPVDRSTCVSCGVGYSWLSLLSNISIGLLKAVVGVLAGSRALLISALYNVNDVLAAIVVMKSLRLSLRAPDASHPYGYGKAEYVAVGIVSFVLIGAVFFTLMYTTMDILRGVPGPPHTIALMVAALSLLNSVFLHQRGHCVSERIDSPALYTSAVHNHADAEGSLLVLIGVAGATLGLHVLDQIIAIIEVIHLAWVAGRTCSRAIKGLLDAAVTELESKIRGACRVAGVERVVTLRTRRTGNGIFTDITVGVKPSASVSEAHDAVARVKSALRGALGDGVRAQVAFTSIPLGKEMASA